MANVSITYDSKTGLNILTYTSADGIFNKIWLEDIPSLKKRFALMRRRDWPA